MQIAVFMRHTDFFRILFQGVAFLHSAGQVQCQTMKGMGYPDSILCRSLSPDIGINGICDIQKGLILTADFPPLFTVQDIFSGNGKKPGFHEHLLNDILDLFLFRNWHIKQTFFNLPGQTIGQKGIFNPAGTQGFQNGSGDSIHRPGLQPTITFLDFFGHNCRHLQKYGLKKNMDTASAQKARLPLCTFFHLPSSANTGCSFWGGSIYF